MDLREQLRSLIAEGEQFTYDNFAAKGQYGYPESLAPAWFSWTGRVRIVVDASFGSASPVARTLTVGLDTQVIANGPDEFNKAKSHVIGALTMGLDALDQGLQTPLPEPEHPQPSSNRVFIVHGHDDALKTELEVFLRGIGLEPVVLHRQPDQGATLIEKFERNADVGYAFVLLTPDDIAFPADDLERPEAQRRIERRARPNVIFEFGFFAGRLGREHVCCIYKGDVALPSDLGGLVYKSVDTTVESIGYALMKELQAAGYAISM